MSHESEHLLRQSIHANSNCTQIHPKRIIYTVNLNEPIALKKNEEEKNTFRDTLAVHKLTIITSSFGVNIAS